MRVSEGICDYKSTEFLDFQKAADEDELAVRYGYNWTFVDLDALAWTPTFTDLYNEIKVNILKGSFYLHDVLFDDIEIQHHQSYGDKNEDIYQSSQAKFSQELPRLLGQHLYEGKFVAFINNEMFVSDDEESLVLEVVKQYGNIPFYFDKVTHRDRDNIEIISGKFVVSE